LQCIWPVNEENRKAKIAQFAEEYGFHLSFYKQGRCAIFEKNRRLMYWELIAVNLIKAGFSWGCSSEIDSTGRVIFSADAYARDGRHFIVLADERLSAFLELERVTGISFMFA
jgi:hypothetical protein